MRVVLHINPRWNNTFASNAVLFHISVSFGRSVGLVEFLRMVICSALFSIFYILPCIYCKGFEHHRWYEGNLLFDEIEWETRFLLFACFYNLLYNRVSAFWVYIRIFISDVFLGILGKHEIVKYTCLNKFSMQHQ